MNPLSSAQLSEAELAWIGAGMAAGHLQQARKPVLGRRTPFQIIRLEHMYAACEWLMFSARYKVLASV